MFFHLCYLRETNQHFMSFKSILFSFFLLLSLSSFAQYAQIRGKVSNENGDPLIAATVIIEKPELIGAYTDDDGIFAFDKMEAGTYEIKAAYFGYDTTLVTVSVEAGSVKTLQIVLHDGITATEEVVITGGKVGKIEKTELKTSVTEITPEQVKIIPSVGAPDLAQYLQLLPGVVFTGDQGGQLYIRGGTPIQNMVLLDGMVIYSPFHSLGLFSVFDIDYIRTTDVYTAAFPAKYGGRVSSIMDIKTRNGSLKQFHAKVNANPFSSGVLLEGPLIKSKKEGAGVSYMVSAKNNYIDKTSPILYPYVKNNADTTTKGLPYNFMDIYGKLSFTDGISYANVFGFKHGDNVNYKFPANVGWNSFGGGANFQLLPDGASAIITGNFAYSSYKSELNTTDETFPRQSSINGFNGGIQTSYIFNKINQLNFGMTVLGFNTNYLFTNSFGYITSQEKSNTEAALYVSYKHVFLDKNVSYSTRMDKSFERIVLEPSIRLHYFNDQQYFSPEPRLRTKFNFNRFSLSASSGIFAQNILSAQSDKDVVNIFQGFLSSPERDSTNTMQHAYHGVLGAEFELVKNLSTAVEGWYKGFSQILNTNRDKLFPEDPNFVLEKGRAFGVDVILKYATANTYLYATYGWAKVTRTDAKITYNPVFDRRHTLNLVAAYKYGRFEAVSENGRAVRSRFTESKWEASGRFTMGSGFPFTQTQGYTPKNDFLDNGSQTDYTTQNPALGTILSSDFNGGRLPYYHRFDISAKRRFVFNNRMMLELNASLINVYNRRNIFYFDRVRYVPVYQLPVLPSFGISFTY